MLVVCPALLQILVRRFFIPSRPVFTAADSLQTCLQYACLSFSIVLWISSTVESQSIFSLIAFGTFVFVVSIWFFCQLLAMVLCGGPHYGSVRMDVHLFLRLSLSLTGF